MTSKGLRSVIWSKQPARLLFSSFDSLGPTWQTPRSFRDEPSRSPTRASALLGSSSPTARGLSSVHPRRSRSEAAFCLPLSPRPLLRPQEKHIESCLLLPLHIEGSPCIRPAINAGESRLPGHDADALTICLQQAVLGFIPSPCPGPVAWSGHRETPRDTVVLPCHTAVPLPLPVSLPGMPVTVSPLTTPRVAFLRLPPVAGVCASRRARADLCASPSFPAVCLLENQNVLRFSGASV